MPFTSGLASVLHVGAKTWRPKTNEQQAAEVQQKRLAEEELRREREAQQKLQTLEQAMKLDARTQALNEKTLAAEIRMKEHELAMRERQMAEERQVELARLQLAKRIGQESLTEADLARIKRERMKAELLARAASNHAAHEHSRPISGLDLGSIPTPRPPPPPMIHSLPPPMPPGTPQVFPSRSPSMSFQPLPHLIPPPPHPSMPSPMLSQHRRNPSEPMPRMRRMSDSFTSPPIGLGRSQWGLPSNALRGGNHPTPARPASRSDFSDSNSRSRNLRARSEAMVAELAIRAQAERLRRRRLETLDLKARQLQLRAEALRDLRQRELVSQLRERGLQQREIEAQARLLAERDKHLSELQLRELRDREHRLMLKEKGLQEREIMEQIRRREEVDRDLLSIGLERLERELRRKELLEAELAIKRALEKGETSPMGIARPSIEEIEREGLLNDDFWEEFDELDPRLRHEILSESGLSNEFGSRTPGGMSSSSLNSRMAQVDRNSARTPTVGSRTPLMRAHSPNPSLSALSAHDRLREEQRRVQQDNHMREERLHSISRANTPRLRDEMSQHHQTAGHHRDDFLAPDRHHGMGGGSVGMNTPRMRGEEMLGDNLSRNVSSRPRSQSFDRRPPSVNQMGRTKDEMMINDDMDTRGREAHKAREAQRRRDDLIAREETNRAIQDINQYNSQHLNIPPRSASRASSRGPDYDSVPRCLSRNSSMREDHSPIERLGLPSRPSSRNFTAEDLGLNLNLGSHHRAPSRERERLPSSNNSNRNDALLTARLQSAAVNSEINGGRRSRTSSRVEPLDDDLLRSARSQAFSDVGASSPLIGRRSRANSRVESIHEDSARNARTHPMSSDMHLSSMVPVGGRSRANSRANEASNHEMDLMRRSSSRNHNSNNALGVDLNNTGGMGQRSRANSINPCSSSVTSPNLRVNREHHHGGSSSARSPHGIEHLGPSRPPSRHANPSRGPTSSLTNEELSRLSTAELEMLLAESASGRTHDDLSRLSPAQIDALLATHENNSMPGGMSHLDIGSSAGHGYGSGNLARRSSRVNMGESPPFGGDQSYPSSSHNYDQSARSTSRTGDPTNGRHGGPLSSSSAGFGDSRYENRPSGSRPVSGQFNSPGGSVGGSRSLYNMPGHLDMSPGEGESRYDSGRSPYMADYHTDEYGGPGGREFVITENHEQPGARILERLGTVKADSRSRPYCGGEEDDDVDDGGLNERNEMHRAVKNLMTEASRLGANGIVSLRVTDLPDGCYIASGQAVILG